MHEIRAISGLFAPTARQRPAFQSDYQRVARVLKKVLTNPDPGNPNSNANQVMTVSFQH